VSRVKPPALGSAPGRSAPRLRAVLARLPIPRSVSYRHLAAVGALLILVQWGVAHVSYAVQAAGALTPVFGDGPYQLFNPTLKALLGRLEELRKVREQVQEAKDGSWVGLAGLWLLGAGTVGRGCTPSSRK